jgi:hypothetical protein
MGVIIGKSTINIIEFEGMYVYLGVKQCCRLFIEQYFVKAIFISYCFKRMNEFRIFVCPCLMIPYTIFGIC